MAPLGVLLRKMMTLTDKGKL